MNSASIHSAYERFIQAEEKRSSSGPRPYVYASSWSACTRQITLDMLHPESKKEFSPDTLANFRRGRDRERDLISDLTRVGRLCDPSFDVVGGQERFELRDHRGRVAIVGKVDARIKFDGQHGAAPLEIKSYHPSLIANVREFEDLFGNRWLRKGAHQLLAYLLATNEPLGFLLLDRPGIPLPLDVRLFEHLDKIEDFLQRAEVALDAKLAIEAEEKDDDIPFATLPPYIDDPSECRVCDFFGSLCNPPFSHEAAQVIMDEQTILKTERYADLKAMPEIEEHEQLEKWAKSRYRGVEQAIVGKTFVTGKWQKTTVYEIPEDVANQIEVLRKPYRKTVEQGKWFLKIEKVSE